MTASFKNNATQNLYNFLLKAAAAVGECPVSIRNARINQHNAKKAVKLYDYGPINRSDTRYWRRVARKRSINEREAKKSRCKQCAAFDLSPRMKENMSNDPRNAGEMLGYCWRHSFKCLAVRSCKKWTDGGPIRKDSESYLWQRRMAGYPVLELNKHW